MCCQVQNTKRSDSDTPSMMTRTIICLFAITGPAGLIVLRMFGKLGAQISFLVAA